MFICSNMTSMAGSSTYGSELSVEPQMKVDDRHAFQRSDVVEELGHLRAAAAVLPFLCMHACVCMYVCMYGGVEKATASATFKVSAQMHLDLRA